MNFIRANAFIFLTLAVVLVVGGGLLIVNSSVGGDVAKMIKDLEAVSGKMMAINRQSIINEDVVEAEKQRVVTIRQQAAELDKEQVEKNKNAYPVLELPIFENGQVSRHVPAFPVDLELDRMHGLNSAYQRLHRERTMALLNDLGPTVPATEEEIALEAKSQEVILMMQRPAKPAETPGMTGAPTPAPAMRGPGMPPDMPDMDMGMPGMAPPRGANQRSTSPVVYPSRSSGNMALGVRGGQAIDSATAEQAKQQARDVLLRRKAENGKLYADVADILSEVSYPRNEPVDPPWSTLWVKQYKLWIASDVAAAIKGINDEVLDKLPENQRNVINAPIKHWLKITIDNNYFFGGTTSSSSSSRTTAAKKPAAGYAMPVYPHAGRGGMPPGGPDMYVPDDIGMPHGEMAAPADPSSKTYDVTGRLTDTNQDIIRYQFSVVMPSRHIQKFMTRLMDGNSQDFRRYHTILETSIEQLPATLSGYYYGNDMVVVATFTCQFMMLPVWARPLAPEDFLRGLHPTALRSEDQARTNTPLY
ncbi:MAG: hypothetical protein GXY38_00210 [Planctomycetes bacterium]|jgi:hypothetical protein|nr:hypothetical protein [Planctomycetota bacterium]